MLWSDAWVCRDFFRACDRYRKAPEVMGNYATVYDWISYGVLKGAQSPAQVRAFAERVYNSRKKRMYSNRARRPSRQDAQIEEKKEEDAHDIEDSTEDEEEEEDAPILY
jgi:hypothetical protein